VEVAIEEGEVRAMEFINNETKNILL